MYTYIYIYIHMQPAVNTTASNAGTVYPISGQWQTV